MRKQTPEHIEKRRKSYLKWLKAHPNRKLSKEHKRKISVAGKGRKHSDKTKERLSKYAKSGTGHHFVKGQIPFMKGKKTPMETRIKQSLAKTKDKEFKGFRKDLRFQLRANNLYFNWRSEVLKRDNYHCQSCGKQGYLEVHHLIPFSQIIKTFEIKTLKQARNCKELWDIGNGITYCVECHMKIDKERGKFLVETVA